MNDSDDEPGYKRRGFMARELNLYRMARMGTRLAQRNGNGDDAIRPIAEIAAVRRVRATRGLTPIDDLA